MSALGRTRSLALGCALAAAACSRPGGGAPASLPDAGPASAASASATAKASAASPAPAAPGVSMAPNGVITERGTLPTATSTPTVITAAALVARMDESRARLESWIRDGVSDPKLPWAMAHGLLAFGPELRTLDGRLAIDALVADNARVVKGRIHLPDKTAAGGIVDAHPNLSVKKMLEAGVPWDHRFTVKGLAQPVTLERLAKDALADFTVPATDQAWAAAPWSVYITLADAKRQKSLDPAARRKLEALALQTLAQLENEQDFLAALLEQQRPDLVQKQKQHIYAHPCGGLHFVQAALHSAAFLGTAEAYARARKQLEVVMFRWMAEREIYRRTGAAQPQYRLLILVQELKFYGHVLEVFALARELGLVDRDPALVVQLGGVAQDLLRTIDLLAGAYGQLDRLRATSEQTYLDVIGDGAHAVHGLRQASVAFFRPQ